MSMFSRECLLRHHSPFQTSRALHFFLHRTSSQQPRFISSTTILRAVKKTRPPQSLKSSLPKKKPSYTPTKSSPSSTTLYQTYASTLAQKSYPTLLYQAPSHTLFIISCYSAGFFCLSYAGVNFYSHYLTPSSGLDIWVPYAFGVISIGMAGFGTWLVLGPARIIKTITAIPKSLSTGPGAVKNVAKTVNPELQIEVELRRMFPVPFFPARKVYVSPEEVVMRHALALPPPGNMSAEQLRAVRLDEEKARQKQLEYERSHLMSAPFRHMNRAFFSLFKAMGRSWSREGFLRVEVKGQRYKLDVNGGWALDRGRALDRLATVKPS